ncbi:MAG TPA: ComEC/Rec2 family competence protein [Patescibacteria group bacterium]|nr:ComEC/Rec2 family competence protein [Patescibacteria group bacterium]
MKHIIWPLLFLLVAVRYFTARPVYQNGDRIRISATVYQNAVKYPSSQFLKIAGLEIYLPKYPEISYGDKLVLEGTVEGRKLKKPQIVSIDKKTSLLPLVRNKIIDFIGEVLPQPESGLLAGILLGAKSQLDPDFYDKTKATGVAHVVVASGTNVTFVVSFLAAALFLFLPRKKAIPFVILGIILYLFIAGFDAPLVRAAIMSSCLFLSQATGRLSNPKRILILAAAGMLIINPQWIADLGFWLSFASTAAILLFRARIHAFLSRVPAVIREDLSTTLSAQIGVTPILFVSFGYFNILSPLINVLVLWTVPPLMLIGALGGVLGLAVPLLGKLVLLTAYPMLWWFTRVVEFFG